MRMRHEATECQAILQVCSAQLSCVRWQLRQLKWKEVEGQLAWVTQAGAEDGPNTLRTQAVAALQQVVEAINNKQMYRTPVAVRDVLQHPDTQLLRLVRRLQHGMDQEQRRCMVEEVLRGSLWRRVLAFFKAAVKAMPLQDLVNVLGTAHDEGVLLDLEPPAPQDKVRRVVAHILQVAQHEIYMLQEADPRADKWVALNETHELLLEWMNRCKCDGRSGRGGHGQHNLRGHANRGGGRTCAAGTHGGCA